MGHGENPERPGPPPDLSEPVKVLRILLNQNLARLKAARLIEEERSFVFPETTVIMRDIWKYAQELERRSAGGSYQEIPEDPGAQEKKPKRRSRLDMAAGR